MDRPNILLITSDQHRANCLGVAEHPCVSTPHLDRLAYEGVHFTRAYTNCPVCIPARTSMITGRDAHRNGKAAYAQDFRVERKHEEFLGSLITRAGYQSCLIGKTHWHTPPSYRAGFESVITQRRLFEERRSLQCRPNLRPEGIGFNEMHPTLSQFPPHLYSTDWTVDQCVRFIQHRDETVPFFLWASFTDPHPPLSIHEPYYSLYDNAPVPEPIQADWADGEECPVSFLSHKVSYNPGPMQPWEIRKMRSVYYGMITNIDHQLGRLFGCLQNNGTWDNTWVIYTTDHGEHLCDYGNIAKSSFLDRAARLPFIVRPPKAHGAAKGTNCSSLVELSDLLPTLCEVAGTSSPTDISGRSLLPLVENPEARVRDALHGHIDDSHVYIEGKYKYLYFVADGAELVFDMENDPEEKKNLASDRELADSLRARFVAHLKSENHPDLSDGELLNKGQTRKDLAAYRAMNPAGWQPAGR